MNVFYYYNIIFGTSIVIPDCNINIFILNFSEYDSEMDDFIDDSDAKIDISAEIRNIFGYDRRKFRDEVRVLKT